tara:strand:- start:79 stop:774 length:696 start_codon:yes stop_codon:yes gene_type:complete
MQGQPSTSAPASIPIAESMSGQERGMEQGVENTQDAINLANTAEGALSSVSDSLVRIKELAVQASNGILNDNDKSAIQSEINELKSGISDTLQDTSFNNIKLFDGFNGNVQTGPSSEQGQTMTIENTSLDTLGIKDFDVTGSFDIADIDKALDQVNSERSDIGAQTNSLESNIRYNEITRENTLNARSNIVGDDIEKALMDLRQDQLKQSISNQMLSMKQKEEEDKLNIFG